MRAAAQFLTHFMSYGAEVSPRRDAGAEAQAGAVDCKNFQLLDFYLHRLQDYFFLLTRQLVGWDALNFFGRKWRRRLLNHAAKLGGQGFDLIAVQVDFLWRRNRFALGVVGIGG